MATKKEYGVYHVSNQQGNDPDAIKFTEQELTSEEKAQARENIGAAPDDIPAVKYVAQTLTDAQKAQARTNINAPSVADLNAIGNGSYVESWDGASTPVVADIPAGVVVTYNTTDYTGTLAASASTVGKIYLVSTGTSGNYDRYITEVSGSTYSWKKIGTTAIDLSDYATKGEVDQLEAKVDGQESNIVYGESYDSQGTPTTKEGWLRSVDYVPVAQGDTVVWNPGAVGSNGASLIVYNGNKEVLDYWASNGVERTINLSLAGTAYIRACFAETNKQNAKLIVNGAVVWTPVDAVAGLTPAVNELTGRVTTLESDVNDATELLSKVAVHHTKTTVNTSSLVVESGGQTISFDGLNFRPGRKYTITAESDTDNTGYFNLDVQSESGEYGKITENITQNINANPYTFVFNPTVNKCDLRIYIRGISVAGNVTVTVVEEWGEATVETAEDVLVYKPGKNLADPRKFVQGNTVFLYPTNTVAKALSLYGTGRAITGYIPIKDGQTLVCNVSAGSNAYNYAALFKEVGDLTAIPGTEVRVDTDVVRTITNNLGYDAYAVFTIAEAATDVQVEVGSSPTFYEEYFALRGYMPEDGIDISAYGVMQTYPDELKKVESSLKDSHSGTRLHFVHLSDNHGGSFGNADVFTDPSPASFLVNTGDLVVDKFSDSYDTTKGLILAMTKPGYVTLGNHDCYNSTSLQARFEKFIEPLNTHNGLTGNTKTYYSVDFATEKVKCIFLDMNDGYDDTAGMGMNYLVAGKMSSEQINWFASELQDAKTSGYDVAVFVHVSPDYVDIDRKVDSFYDEQVSKATGVAFLCDMVDGFINGGTVSFTADGVDYSFTFVAGGKFAGWFCGHTHYDSYGWLKDHPKQFSCSIARPSRNNDTFDGTYRIPKLGVTWDYVTIDATTHTMAVLRMGNQETIYGTTRNAFYIKY